MRFPRARGREYLLVAWPREKAYAAFDCWDQTVKGPSHDRPKLGLFHPRPDAKDRKRDFGTNARDLDVFVLDTEAPETQNEG